MSNCPHCAKAGAATRVPDFEKEGFSASASAQLPSAAAQAQTATALALRMQACLSATYNPGTNQICFTVPIYGDYCVTSPVPIPIGGQLKACVETCGSFIPSGLKVTIYLNGGEIYSTVLWGTC